MNPTVGVIGAGKIAHFHLEGYRKAGARVSWVADVCEERAADKAKAVGCRHTDDYSAILADPEVDSVSVCVPNNLHYEVARQALRAGKHVLCEKPMTTRVKDARELVAEARKAGTIFQVAYMKRFHPAFVKAKALVERLGALRASRFRVFHGVSTEETWRERAAHPELWWGMREKDTGGCALPHSGSHFLDLMLWLCGEPVSVEASVTERPERTLAGIDFLDACFFRMKNGSTAYFEVWWHPLSGIGFRNDGWEEGLELNGDNGRLELSTTPWDGNDPPVLKTYLEDEHESRQYHVSPENQFDAELRAFVEAVREGKERGPNVVDGYRVQEIIDAIYRSGREGRSVPITFAC